MKRFTLEVDNVVLLCTIELTINQYRKVQKIWDLPKYKWETNPLNRAIMENGCLNDRDIECNGHLGPYIYFTCNTIDQAQKIRDAVQKVMDTPLSKLKKYI